jgi:hypothetical protein
VAAEHGDDGGIPASEESGGQVALIRNEPTHGGGGADAGIRERSCQTLQPGFAGTAIGIGEDQNFKFFRKLLDGDTEIIDFFAAICGFAGDYDVGFDARRSYDALNDGMCGVSFGSEDKEDFVILVIEFAEGDEVAFKAGFHTAARAEDRGAGSGETGVCFEAPADIKEPLNAQPNEIEASRDLKDSQDFE